MLSLMKNKIKIKNERKKREKCRGQRKTEKAIIKVIKHLIKKIIWPKIEKLLKDLTAYVNKK